MTANAKLIGINCELSCNAINKKAKLNLNEKLDDNSINTCLVAVADAILSGEFHRARKLLKESVSKDMENPETYNLLGILYEEEGDRLKASRFYRVAFYMDQTFKPAADNLDRICDFWYKGNQNIQWGLEFRR